MVEIKEISYEKERLNFFLDKRRIAQKRYHRIEKAIKPDEPYLSDRRQLLSDCGRELNFYNDIISMLEADSTTPPMPVKKQLEPLYDEICAKLTDYEHCKDPETTDKDWLEEFYLLLVKTQNSIDMLEENF